MLATLQSNNGLPAGVHDLASDLAPGAVHLWRFPCDAETARREHERSGRCVSASERSRAERFKFPQLREQYLLQHGVVRQLLSLYLHSSPEEIAFTFNARGKPLLDAPAEPSLRFNLAHTKDEALLAIARDFEVGVDLEQLRAGLDPAALERLVCAPDEAAWIHSQPEPERRRAFLRIWCRKEAALKAAGIGLIDRLPSLSVLGDSASFTASPSPCFERLVTFTVHLQDLALGPAHAGALAASQPIAPLLQERSSREV